MAIETVYLIFTKSVMCYSKQKPSIIHYRKFKYIGGQSNRGQSR